jgi:hypothetical protein
LLLLIAGCAAAIVPVRSIAAPNVDEAAGIAFDTIAKSGVGEIPHPYSGDFADDLRLALASKRCEPFVVRRFVTRGRERIESPCTGEATIIDCAARTVTTLALRDRTYYVMPLDQGAVDKSVLETAAALNTSIIANKLVFRDVIESTPLGVTPIGGTVATVYQRNEELTSTSTSQGQTSAHDSTYYLSTAVLPALSCNDAAAPWLGRYSARGGAYSPERPAHFRPDGLLAFTFTIVQHGPDLPTWRIPLFGLDLPQIDTGMYPGGCHCFTVIESGNIRAIHDDDVAFTVPPGFARSN